MKTLVSLFRTACDDEEIDIAARVLRSGKLVMGEHVEALEEELSLNFDRSVVTCASGTDALVLALEALVDEGAEVIVPAMTFSATLEAVLLRRAIPVVVDVSATMTLSVDAIAAAMTDRTQAVILVHLYGWPAADTKAIGEFCRARGVVLIEDCAQAFGAMIDAEKVGTFGDAAAFSFYPTKPLGGVGDGGAVSFRSERLADEVRAFRNHGRVDGRQPLPGRNSRMDEVNAAVLRHRLAKHEATIAHLLLLVRQYRWHGIQFRPLMSPAPYVMPVLVDARDALVSRLAFVGVETRVHYDPPVSALPYVIADCPTAERAARRVLSLPCHRGMKVADVDLVAQCLNVDKGVA